MITQTDKTHQTGNPELQTASTMSIMGFCLYKNYEFWFSLQNCYITEHPCEYENTYLSLSKSFQGHVHNIKGQQKKGSLLVVTLITLFVQPAQIL